MASLWALVQEAVISLAVQLVESVSSGVLPLHLLRDTTTAAGWLFKLCIAASLMAYSLLTNWRAWRRQCARLRQSIVSGDEGTLMEVLQQEGPAITQAPLLALEVEGRQSAYSPRRIPALHLAASTQFAYILRALLVAARQDLNNADPRLEALGCYTAMWFALRYNRAACVEVLLPRCPRLDSRGRSVQHYIAMLEQEGIDCADAAEAVQHAGSNQQQLAQQQQEAAAAADVAATKAMHWSTPLLYALLPVGWCAVAFLHTVQLQRAV